MFEFLLSLLLAFLIGLVHPPLAVLLFFKGVLSWQFALIWFIGGLASCAALLYFYLSKKAAKA